MCVLYVFFGISFSFYFKGRETYTLCDFFCNINVSVYITIQSIKVVPNELLGFHSYRRSLVLYSVLFVFNFQYKKNQHVLSNSIFIHMQTLIRPFE